MRFEKYYKKIQPWLLPVMMILFILELATLPLVVRLTYTGRAESPDRVLTYTHNNLEWDSAAAIDENGVVELSLFSAYYDHVASNDGDKVLAPGTAGSTIIRLANASKGEVSFTAVVYEIKSSETLDIETKLEGLNFYDSSDVYLPEDVQIENVIRCVNGTLAAGAEQDFDIEWVWDFELDEQKDINDTLLGNAAASGSEDDVLIGFYLVVEDDNEIVKPGTPETGDVGLIEVWIVLLVVSGAVLIFLFWLKKREKENQCA